jgi:hypothetical protein
MKTCVAASLVLTLLEGWAIKNVTVIGYEPQRRK